MRPAPPVLGIERCGDWVTERDCGAGVYLCWHHRPEEAEGSFAIEKTFYETGGTRHWEYYRSRIPASQRNLFVPISDFLINNVNFRMRYSRIMPPDPEEIEGEELYIIREAVPEDFFYSLDDEDTTYSMYSNIVGMVSQPPPVLLKAYRDLRICGGAISFYWTPIEKIDNYEYEVSDDPTFMNRERVIREHIPAQAEDHAALYDDPEDYEAAVLFWGPLELLGVIYLDDSILSDAEVLYVHVRSLVGWPPKTFRSNWSNVLSLRL